MTEDKTCVYCGSKRMVAGFLEGARLSFQPVSRDLADTMPGIGAAVESYACLDCGGIQLACGTKELQLARGK